MPKAKKEEAQAQTFPKIKIQQIGSPIRRHKDHALYLKGWGLGKMNRVRELEANPTVLGLIRKAQHMIKIIQD